jgi:DNA-3-methyladenine glycosylase II
VPTPFADSHRHLSRRDPRLKSLIKQVGPCTIAPHPDAFRILASSIISQQISTKAAATINGRVTKLCGRGGLKAMRIMEISDEELRNGSKLLSMRSLASFFLDNPALVRGLKKMPDEEVIEALLPIRGVGVWTAQMFLIFCLGRPDVLPTADLGFRAGVRSVFGLAEMPTNAELEVLAEPWRPHRTAATWYFWRSHGLVPQVE